MIAIAMIWAAHNQQWLIHQWTRFWFEPSKPTNLGLGRLLFFGSMLYLYAGMNTSLWADVSDVFWMPITLFQRLHLPVLPGHLLDILDVLWKIALGLSAIGFFTRTSAAVSFVLGLYLLGLPHNFGKTHHADAILVLIMGVMAVSRCGDSWSIDTAIRTYRDASDRGEERAVLSGEYTWPIRLIWVLMVMVFFGAGISKIRHAGLEWIVSDNLALLLIRHHYSHYPPTLWGLYVAQHGWLCRLLGLGTVGLEVSAPLALASRKLRLLYVPSLVVMQLGIWILMGVLFLPYFACYHFWVPWDRLPRFKLWHKLRS